MSKIPQSDNEGLTESETEALLSEAEDAFPESDYAASVQEWYLEHQYLTEAQKDALNNIIEKSYDRHS